MQEQNETSSDNSSDSEEQQSKKSNQEEIQEKDLLQRKISILTDLQSYRDESYYRMNHINILEAIQQELARVTKTLNSIAQTIYDHNRLIATSKKVKSE